MTGHKENYDLSVLNDPGHFQKITKNGHHIYKHRKNKDTNYPNVSYKEK